LFFRVSELLEENKLATEQPGRESGEFLILESFATKIMLRLSRQWSFKARTHRER